MAYDQNVVVRLGLKLIFSQDKTYELAAKCKRAK